MKNCLSGRMEVPLKTIVSKYKVFTKLFLLLLFIGSTGDLMAQVPVSGTVVTGENAPLSGVTVQVKGSNTASQTDDAGKFTISAPSNGTLVISYVGYQDQEVKVGNRTSISVTLAPAVGQLSDVVVIGYGTQKRKDVVGAVSSISGDKIAERPVATFDQALQGLAPGLQIAQRNASPGELSTINLRGIGSLSAGFEPLFVVDGFPTNQKNATAINPSDIQSIEILKDASSTAIFGSRGANGVIIITTKMGKGKAKLDVNLSTGVSKVNKRELYDVLNAEQYVTYYKEYFPNMGLPVPDAIANWDGTDTDWQDLVYRTAPFSNASVSVNGGDEKVSYLFSGNYAKQEGTLIGEGFERYSARIKVDYRPSKSFAMGINIAPNFELTKRSSPREQDHASIQSTAGLLPPIVPIRKQDGSYATFNDILPGVFNNIANPLETAELYKDKTRNALSLINAYAQVRIIDGLILKTSVGAGLQYNTHKLFYTAPKSGSTRLAFPATTTLNVDASNTLNWLIENTLNYKKVFADVHSVELLAGYTSQKVANETLAGATNTFLISGPETLGFGSSVNRTGNNGASGNSLISYLGRANYTYNDRYILSASIRRDGSSRFGAANRYHTFGSLALGWRITEENFMKGVNFINNAKLRASYGTTGSNDINDFTSRASLRSVNHSFNGTQVIGVRNQDPGNVNLTWETSRQMNFGFDVDVMNSRLNLIFDYYRNTTEDLLLQENVVLSSGFPGVLTNIGKVRNKGFELSANYRIIDRKDFTWSIGANVTHNDQKILELGKNQTELFNFFGALRSRIGYEIQQIQGVKAIGIVREGHIPPQQPTAVPGDIEFEDVNGDNVVSNFLGVDGQLLGDPNLDWIYGVNTTLRYKNWTLSALANGQQGGYVFDFYLIQIQNATSGVNFSKQFWYDGRYINEANPGDGRTPRAGGLAKSAEGAGAVSSLGVQKTDFLRIRNVALYYDIPVKSMKKLFISNAQVYASVENLYTFTNYIGGNPYSQRPSAGGPGLIGGSRVVGDNRELSLNSVGSAPLPRVMTIGINVTF